MQKNQDAGLGKKADGGKKETRKIERTYNYFYFISLYALVSS